jgi:hypothetical protein
MLSFPSRRFDPEALDSRLFARAPEPVEGLAQVFLLCVTAQLHYLTMPTLSRVKPVEASNALFL